MGLTLLATSILLAEDDTIPDGWVEEKEGIDAILPPMDELIWGTIAFFVLFGLLWKFAFPALQEAMQKRSDTIATDLKAAEEAKLEAEQVLAEYREQLASAKTEAGRIIEESRRQADDIRKEITAKAEEQAQEIIENGRRDVGVAVGQAQADLQRQLAQLSVDLAGRIISEHLDLGSQQRIVDDFIAEVGSLSGAGG